MCIVLILKRVTFFLLIMMPCVENHIVALSFPEETKEQKKKAHLYFFSFRPEIHPYVFTKGVQGVPPPKTKNRA